MRTKIMGFLAALALAIVAGACNLVAPQTYEAAHEGLRGCLFEAEVPPSDLSLALMKDLCRDEYFDFAEATGARLQESDLTMVRERYYVQWERSGRSVDK